MSTRSKPRADATLKTLPPDRQAQIAEYLRDHSLQAAVQWLRAEGLKTSTAALSQFLSWYQLRAQLSRNESTVETLLTQLKNERPDWTPEQIQAVGQSFFTALALEQQDAKSWFLTQQLALKREQLNLDREKFQRETVGLFIKWSADKEATQLASSNLPTAEKTERLGQRLFGDLWK